MELTKVYGLYLVASEIENQISEHDQGRGENMESSRNILRQLLDMLLLLSEPEPLGKNGAMRKILEKSK